MLFLYSLSAVFFVYMAKKDVEILCAFYNNYYFCSTKTKYN